jgi:hypothetical protein
MQRTREPSQRPRREPPVVEHPRSIHRDAAAEARRRRAAWVEEHEERENERYAG